MRKREINLKKKKEREIESRFIRGPEREINLKKRKRERSKVDLYVGPNGPGRYGPVGGPRRPVADRGKKSQRARVGNSAGSFRVPTALRNCAPFLVLLTGARLGCSGPSSKTLTPRDSPAARSGSRSSPPSRRYTRPHRFPVRPRFISPRTLITSVGGLFSCSRS
jgi:hypothetical protein